jgi:Protein of unknown function (DUF3158)
MSAPSFGPVHRIARLEQTDYLNLKQAPYLKGLLKPFKGKGELEAWSKQCSELRDSVIELARRRILAQARASPFNLLPLQLSDQTTAAGTTFLRWRSIDRSSMGVALWQTVINAPTTPTSLISGLYELEQHRIVLNMQISLTHSIARQAHDCAIKLAQAETVYRGQAIR